MPVDIATAAFLDAVRAGGGKPLYEQTPEEMRAGIRGGHLQLAPTAPEIESAVDRSIGPRGAEFGIRIYTPHAIEAGKALPLLLQFHGGGFVGGDLDTHDAASRYYAVHADAVVIAVDYRRPPEHKFPAAVDDAYAALEWAAAHAEEIRGDRARIAVTGDSAGGNLSAVVCQLAKARGGPKIAFQALVYPQVDLDVTVDTPSRVQFGTGDYFLSRRDFEFLRSLYLTDVEAQVQDPRASPLKQRDLSGLPPALVVTAGYDPLLDEGKAYADRLSAAGVPVEYRCFAETIHGFTAFAAAIPAGLEGLAFIATRLRAALHGQ
jgi:acetyl esterase